MLNLQFEQVVKKATINEYSDGIKHEIICDGGIRILIPSSPEVGTDLYDYRYGEKSIIEGKRVRITIEELPDKAVE